MGFEFIITNKNLTYLTIPSFTQTGKVKHAYTARKGGVSGPPFESLNLGFHVGDEKALVSLNRERVCNLLGIESDALVAARQVHGDLVYAADAQDKGRGALDGESAIPGVDALVTNVSSLPLVAFFADCVCVFLLDPVMNVIGLVHAGWKGTALKIGAKTVRRMERIYNSKPRDILAGIAPSIGPCCYEVDQPVVNLFRKSFPDWGMFIKPKCSGRWNLDLWEANKRILIDSGVPEDNISVAGLCTSCNNDLFFSYRAESGRTGRLAGLLMLK